MLFILLGQSLFSPDAAHAHTDFGYRSMRDLIGPFITPRPRQSERRRGTAVQEVELVPAMYREGI